MSYSNFTKHKADLGKDCEHWEAIQKHRYCFHVSHKQPITWSECGHLRRHVNDALLVMHPRQDMPLPVLMIKDSFMRKVSPNSVTSKPFHVDAEIRGEYDSRENRRFAVLGYRSMNMNFTPEQVQTLKKLLAKAASGPGIPYHDGRSGHRIDPKQLKTWDPTLLRAIFNEELQHTVLHYFAGSRKLVLYRAEVLRTLPFSPAQSFYSDIADVNENVSTIRLAVVVLISVDSAATTEVYPRTRVCGPFFHYRDCVRATQDENCVLFDASLAHQGAANNTSEPNLKLCLVFINADASKEQQTVVNACLQSKSLDLHVADLLSVELESGTSKRKAEQSAPNLTVRQGRRNFASRS